MTKSTPKHPCKDDATAPNEECVITPAQPVTPHREENIDTAKKQHIPGVERKTPPKPKPRDAE